MKRLKALWKNEERGQALVEFTLVGIIFFILVFGTMDVGRAVWNYNTLAQATREGARFAVVHGARCDAEAGCSAADLAAVEAVVIDNASGLNSSQVTVGVDWVCRTGLGSCNEVWDHVTVTSQYDYAPMSFFTGLFSLPSVTMTSTSTMEIHY